MINWSRLGGRSLAFIAAAACLAVALSSAGPARARAGAAFDGARLTVDTAGFGSSGVTVGLALQDTLIDVGAPGVAASVDLTIPTGFSVNLTERPGKSVGMFFGVVASASGSGESTFIHASVVVDDPVRYASDGVAQACAPGSHSAMWRISPEILGRALELPVAVDSTSGPAGTSYTLRFCPLETPSAAYPSGLAITATTIEFDDSVTAPTRPGSYRWSAVVTPAVPGALTPDPSKAFELRAVVPVPQSLTLRARYDAQTHNAVISGSLRFGSLQPVAADVQITSSSTSGRERGSTTTTRTKSDGTFVVRRPIAESTLFTARVSSKARACIESSATPGGCRSETVPGVTSDSALVVVPRKTDPQVSTTMRDQASARRSVPSAGDLAGATVMGDAPPPCASFAPHLHHLTATGYAASPRFLTSDGKTGLYGTATVFASADEAAADFRSVATSGAARCEGSEIARNFGQRSAVTPKRLLLPRIGTESRAYRASVHVPKYGVQTADVLVVRVRRTVISLHVTASGVPRVDLERFVLRVLAARANQSAS